MTTNNTGFIKQNKNILFLALGVGLILLVPFAAMQFSDEMNWSLFDFILLGALLFGTGLALELLSRQAVNNTHRLALASTLVTSLLLLLVNLAVGVIGSEDNPSNRMYVGVLAVLLIGALIVRFQPRGMTGVLAATAILTALAPVIALILGSLSAASTAETAYVLRVFVFNTIFVVMFLGSALLFRRARRNNHKGAAETCRHPNLILTVAPAWALIASLFWLSFPPSDLPPARGQHPPTRDPGVMPHRFNQVPPAQTYPRPPPSKTLTFSRGLGSGGPSRGCRGQAAPCNKPKTNVSLGAPILSGGPPMDINTLNQYYAERNTYSTLETLDVHTGAPDRPQRIRNRHRSPQLDARRALPHLQQPRAHLLLSRWRAARSEIDTGFAVDCNNDHVLSPDGTQLAVSHHTAADAASRIYILPLAAASRASSPKTAPATCTAGRPMAGAWPTAPSAAGSTTSTPSPSRAAPKRSLTNTPGLDDGPEYSPQRPPHLVQLHPQRAHAGLAHGCRRRHPVHAVREDANCWFPHVSPRRRLGGLHHLRQRRGCARRPPANKNVALRLVPAEGGNPKPSPACSAGRARSTSIPGRPITAPLPSSPTASNPEPDRN